MEDFHKLESEFKEKVEDVARWVSKEIGRPSHEVSELIHSGFEKVLPHMSEEAKLNLKKHFVTFGTPILGVYLAYAMTGGHANPEIILPLAIGGFIVGQVERRGIERKMKELEARELEKLKKEVI